MARKPIFQEGRGVLESILSEVGENKIEMISVDSLSPNPNQPRKSFKGLADLGRSIQEEGVIEPLVVRPKGINFEIIAGERRYRAATQYTELLELPCIVRDLTDDDAMRVSLIENLQREDLNPIEETQAVLDYIRLVTGEEPVAALKEMINLKIQKKDFGNVTKKVEDAFEVMGVNWDSFRRNNLPLLDLPDNVKEFLIQNQEDFKPAHAQEVAKIDDKELRSLLMENAVNNGTGVRELRERVKELAEADGREEIKDESKVRSKKGSRWRDQGWYRWRKLPKGGRVAIEVDQDKADEVIEFLSEMGKK